MAFSYTQLGSRIHKLTAALAFIAFIFPAATPIAIAGELDGLRVFANDGTFLGEISCSGIGNRYSRFGSKYNAQSIWNAYGQYGSPYSQLSAYNKYTRTPPALVNTDGDTVGHLTMNRFVAGPKLSPAALENYLMDECNNSDGYR